MPTRKGNQLFRKCFSGAVVAGILTAVGLVGQPMASATALPSGERIVGQTVIEPAYNDANGAIIYLSTPNQTHETVNPNLPSFSHNVAPLYLPVYPVGAPVGTLNCQHLPAPDNCPDHGNLVAQLAAQIRPGVYGGGVLGHDHLAGIASTGGDFNVVWEPVLVLFNHAAAANQHLTTLSQVNAADAIKVPLKPGTFACSVVSAAVYQHGTPVA